MPPRVMLEGGVYVQRAWGGEYGGINQPGATIRGLFARYARREAERGGVPKRVLRR